MTSSIVRLFAAGSLKDALTEVSLSFEAAARVTVVGRYGPSGILKDEVLGGAVADVFASANMDHPRTLHDRNRSGPVVRFARNKLCALAKPQTDVDSAGLLGCMLEASIKLGTSTPKADPSGDYAFDVFRRAEGLMPGAQAALEKKAIQLTGRTTSATPPPGLNVYGWHVAEGHADIFLTYCTNARAAQKQNPSQRIIALPEALSVEADYGVTVVGERSPAAQLFADFIMSAEGQKILASHGFAPAT